MKKRVADIICDILNENGIDECFTVTGGGSMHLNDAFGNSNKMHCKYFLHEQSAAIAAEAYARVDNKLPVVCVTTGPGGTNALTGVLCAWLDNIPMLVISGQVKTSSTVESTGLNLRQFGEQEHRIVETVKSMTKYSIMIKEPTMVKYYIQKAIYEAKSGRRGPCWIDIPLDIQGCQIDPSSMAEYVPEEKIHNYDKNEIVQLLENAKRPVILAGSAIRTGEAYEEFRKLSGRWNVPVVVAKSIADIMPNEDKNYYGNFGINGGRTGNFIVQNADCLLVLGCRLSFGQIGFNYKQFSPNSKKIVVDIDAEELKKSTIKIDCPVNADIKSFLTWLNSIDIKINIEKKWMQYCTDLRNKFPIYQEKFEKCEKVNPYFFAEILKKYISVNAICIMGNSCSAVSIKQCGIEKEGQRLWGNTNCGTMGYDIPAAIGAAIAGKRQVVCCAGDGSFQMNIQELQTIINYNLPIKIFVFNNGGYRSIILSQSKNFGRLSGCTSATGLTLPQLEKIAYAYDIPYYRCESNSKLEEIMENIFQEKGYAICEVIEDEQYGIEPKLGNRIEKNGQITSPSIADLSPFLDDDIYIRYADYSNYLEWINER